MDKLIESAELYKQLLGKDYFYTFTDGIHDLQIKTFFANKNFYHLLGLNKLTDVPVLALTVNNTATDVYSNIAKGFITYDQISRSAHFSKIADRIDHFSSINSMLFEKAVINFDKSITPSKIKADVILYQEKGSLYLHLCLAPGHNHYYPETFLVEPTNYYLKNQKILDVKELLIFDTKTKAPTYHYTNEAYSPDLSTQKEIAAAAYPLRKEKNTMNEVNDKSNELLELLEKGIKDTLDSEHYKAFLRVQSTFHNYSFNNAMLIYLQRPDATRVAGYKTWEKLERHVMKGEKGISILAPNPYKYEILVNKIDPVTKQPVRDPSTGEILQVKQEKTALSFRKVSVFDIKQTDGKELPSICNELQGNSINAEKIINAIKQVSKVPIIEKEIESGAKGYYSKAEDLIALKKDMSLDQTAKTLIHEYAHSKLHNTDAAALLDRATKEVQAESVAYIVSNRFGVDTSEYSFDYLANWSSGKELPELKASFDLIQKTADGIIQEIEGVLTRQMELQNSHAKITILWSESDQVKKGQMFDIEEANTLFTKLDRQQTELRKANEAYDYKNAAAGDNIPYIPYHKTNFELQLSDGRTSEARFDFGESGYKDLYDCIRKECHIDVKAYVKEQELKLQLPAEKPVVSTTVKTEIPNVKDKIIEQYSKSFPAIKHVSEATASFIDNFNQKHGHMFTVKEIKQAYKDAGNWLDKNNNAGDASIFKSLETVVNDLKQAQMIERQVKAQEKALQNQAVKTSELEMVR